MPILRQTQTGHWIVKTSQEDGSGSAKEAQFQTYQLDLVAGVPLLEKRGLLADGQIIDRSLFFELRGQLLIHPIGGSYIDYLRDILDAWNSFLSSRSPRALSAFQEPDGSMVPLTKFQERTKQFDEHRQRLDYMHSQAAAALAGRALEPEVSIPSEIRTSGQAREFLRSKLPQAPRSRINAEADLHLIRLGMSSKPDMAALRAELRAELEPIIRAELMRELALRPT